MGNGIRVLIEFILSQITSGMISAIEGITTFIWWLEKTVGNIAYWFASQDVWATILQSILDVMANVLPSVLGATVVATLFPLALALGGLFMVAQMEERSPVKPADAMVWMVFLTILFINPIPGASGYTLIDQLETVRRNIADTIVSIVAPTGDPRDIVAIPMRATPAGDMSHPRFELPTQFESDYFPAVTNTNTVTAVFFDNWLMGRWEIDFIIEDEGAQRVRQEQAREGLLMAIVSLAPLFLLAEFGVIYMLISAGVMLLILFFFASIPLGFFDIGREIMINIGKMYATIVSLTIASSLFLGIAIQAVLLTLTNNPTLGQMMGFLPVALIYGLVMGMIIKTAYWLLTNVLQVVTTSVRAVVATQVGRGDVPTADPAHEKAMGLAGNVAGLATIGVASLAMGGIKTAIPAIGGSALSRVAPQVGRDVALLTRLNDDSQSAKLFSSTAISSRTVPALLGMAMINRNDPNRAKPAPDPAPPLSAQTLMERLEDDAPIPAVRKLREQAEAHKIVIKKEMFETGLASVRDGEDRRVDSVALNRKRFDGMKALETMSQPDRHALADQVRNVVLQTQSQNIAQTILESPDTNGIDQPIRDIAMRFRLDAGAIQRAVYHAQNAIERGLVSGGGVEPEADLVNVLSHDPAFKKMSASSRHDLARLSLERIGHQGRRYSHQQYTDMVVAPTSAPRGIDTPALYTIRNNAIRHGWIADGRVSRELSTLFQTIQEGIESADKEKKSRFQTVYQEIDNRPEFRRLSQPEKTALAESGVLMVESAPYGKLDPTGVDAPEWEDRAYKIEGVNRERLVVPTPPPSVSAEQDRPPYQHQPQPYQPQYQAQYQPRSYQPLVKKRETMRERLRQYEAERIPSAEIEANQKGQIVRVIGTSGDRYDMQYELRELSTLIPSNDANGKINPDYPDVLQPRDRTRAGSRLQVDGMAKSLDAELLLTEFNSLDRGAPIIGADNAVESGNGRTMALNRAVTQYPNQYNQYRAELAERAEQFGLSPDLIPTMDQPVLVRRRISEVDRLQFTQEANASIVLTMSATEQARSDAERISIRDLMGLEMGDDADTDTALRQVRNRPFIRSFVGNLPDNERAQLITRNGDLTQAGVNRIKGGMLARVYPSEQLHDRILENPDNDMKNITNGLMGSLGQIARAEERVTIGERASDLSIAPDISRAVEKLGQLKGEGMTVQTYLSQQTVFGRELTPVQEKILVKLDEKKRSSKAVKEMMTAWAHLVENQPHPNQQAMFGNAHASRDELINIWLQTPQTLTEGEGV